MELTSSLGAALTLEHDALGDVKRLAAGTVWQAELAHDAQGLEVHRQLSGGVGWHHDGQGRPTSQRITAGVGRASRQRRYEWQGADELTEIADSLLGTTTFGYDGFGALSEARYADGTRELRTPDAVGNLFRTAERTDRRYGAGGQLREANGTRYKYDAEGNLICKTLPGGQQWTYEWDGGGQLVSVKRPDGYAVTFTYDALGRRLSKRFRGRVRHWVWDGDKPLHEWSELEVGPEVGSVADLTTWLFEAGSFAPAAKLTAAGAQSVVCDHLGTPLELYDGQGVKTWQAQLDSYGAVREGKGKAQDCPFRYQGQYEDVETGLYYNRFRYYDPETGQYISQDPIRLLGGSNFYSYVHNPTTRLDVLGLAPGDILTSGTVYRGLRPNQTPFTPSIRDVNEYLSAKEAGKAGMPGFSTFQDTDPIWKVTTKKGPLFNEAAVLDISKLGPDVEAFHDYGPHVSIRPSQSYLNRTGLTMPDALNDWLQGGESHQLSQHSSQAQSGLLNRICPIAVSHLVHTLFISMSCFIGAYNN